MNRRAFLSTLVAGLAGAALDPERLLWVPGQKTIFLPSPRVVRDAESGIAIRFVKDWVPLKPLKPGAMFAFEVVCAINPETYTQTFGNSGQKMTPRHRTAELNSYLVPSVS